MSHLLIVTRPRAAAGFQLAGVETFAVEDATGAQELIGGWLDNGEIGLLAIDEGLLLDMNPACLHRLQASANLPHLAIPGGQPLSGTKASRRHRIAEMIRRAIGFHITFKGEKVEAN